MKYTIDSFPVRSSYGFYSVRLLRPGLLCCPTLYHIPFRFIVIDPRCICYALQTICELYHKSINTAIILCNIVCKTSLCRNSPTKFVGINYLVCACFYFASDCVFSIAFRFRNPYRSLAINAEKQTRQEYIRYYLCTCHAPEDYQNYIVQGVSGRKIRTSAERWDKLPQSLL